MQMQKELRFYEFNQNNSGGEFDYDEHAGITHIVLVQATSADDANARAQGIGLYFDGDGDCSCCGNRWSEQWYSDGMSLEELKAWFIRTVENRWFTKWMGPDRPEVFVHFADGRVVGLVFGESHNLRFMQDSSGLLALEA